MGLESRPYWFTVCDNCGHRADYGDFTAWEQPAGAEEASLACEWTTDLAGRWHCPSCPVLGPEMP